MTAAAPSGAPVLAAREIIDSLATIESCLNLFLGRDRPLARRSLQPSGQRAAVPRKGISPSSVIGMAVRGLEAEGRLSDVKLALTIDVRST